MNAIVKTFAASPEQYSAATSFRLLNKIFVGGSLVCYQEFDSVDSARDYLQQIARSLYSDDVRQMIENTWSFGLTFGNVSAIILTGDQLESFKTIIEHQTQIK